jgi:hypothetical protein
MKSLNESYLEFEKKKIKDIIKVENGYIESSIRDLKNLSEKYYKKLLNDEKNVYLNAIKSLLKGEKTVDTFYIYDYGFFYQNDYYGQPIIVSLIAQRVLTKLYVTNCNLLPVLENKLADTDKGKLLEWHLILRELYGPITLQCKYMGNTETLPSPLKFEVQQIAKYESKQKGFFPFIPNFNLCTLYIPTLKNNFFQFIDHIIRKPHPKNYEEDLIIFNSATLPNILEHMYNSDSKKNFEFGEIEKFIDPNFNLEEKLDYSKIDFEICPICNNKCIDDCILCDYCSFWYHFECEKINSLPNEDKEYKCSKCFIGNNIKKPLIVDILNSIYGFKDKTFKSEIIENENKKNTYRYKITSPDGNEMKNVIILYSCGKKDEEIKNFKKKINKNSITIKSFQITNIQYCSQEDHIKQLNIKYMNDQQNTFEISSIFEQFLDM